MSNGRAIDPLPIDQFPTEADVSDPGFEQLFGDLVGIAGSDADGFDDDVAIANSLPDSIDAALGLMSGQDGGTLDEAFAQIEAIDVDGAAGDVLNTAAALPDVQGNVDNLGNDLTAAGPPTPKGGGGGGGTPRSTDCSQRTNQ